MFIVIFQYWKGICSSYIAEELLAHVAVVSGAILAFYCEALCTCGSSSCYFPDSPFAIALHPIST